MRHVESAKKNAKIAGVDRYIKFARSNIEWLDTKKDKETVDKIITYPPQKTKYVNFKDIEKKYRELFYQAEFILKKKGKVVLITKETETLEKSAEIYKFKLEKKIEVMQGKQKFYILVFVK